MTGHDAAGLAADRAGLAARLLAAQRSITALDLPAEARQRLQRRLMAICDATKAPGTDPARCAGRLDRLAADLEGLAAAITDS